MSDTVIKVENLSKSYTISHQTEERYSALRDVLANGVKNVARPKGSREFTTRYPQPATHQPPPAILGAAFTPN